MNIVPHKLTVKDLSNGYREIQLDWCRLSDGSIEMMLLFYLDIEHDNVWYEIEIGDCDEDGNYRVLEQYRFNSIKKAVAFWNLRIDENDRTI